MRLEIDKKRVYNLIDETKIETVCGALYQAQDLDLGRTVAVKCVRIEGRTPAEKNLNLQRAYAEVRAMVQIRALFVNIPTIFAAHYDQKNSMFYIVMEWIPGDQLTDRIQNCPEHQFLYWMIDLCDILKHMADKNIYHKDIKPDNIMITRDNRLYLIDFNISIATSNLVEGSTNYKAPEMSDGAIYAGRDKVDMFSIGVMLYEFYTKAVPIHTQDYARTRRRGPLIWNEFTEPKQKNPAMSDQINAIIIKCMKYDPRERYRHISDLKEELRKVVKSCGNRKKK